MVLGGAFEPGSSQDLNGGYLFGQSCWIGIVTPLRVGPHGLFSLLFSCSFHLLPFLLSIPLFLSPLISATSRLARLLLSGQRLALQQPRCAIRGQHQPQLAGALCHRLADRSAAQELQHLLTDAAWDPLALDEQRVHLLVERSPANGVLVLDDTGPRDTQRGLSKRAEMRKVCFGGEWVICVILRAC